MRINPRGQQLLDRLAAGETLISDGATGSYLQLQGLEPGGCPEEFNVTQPEIIRGMAKAYFDAGSDMVLTNSFGGSRFRLKHYGFEDRVMEFNRLAAEHARSQAPEDHFVVGSVGPTGEFIEPIGEVSEQDMYEAFVEQIAALEAGGADGVNVETMISMDEAKVAIRAAKENTDLVVMSTMTFDKGPRGLFSMTGTTPAEAALQLREAGADVVGANCGNGIDVMIEVAQSMREATDTFILVHSNAGIPQMKGGKIIYPETPDYMAKRFKTMVKLGVNVVGGCCGTTPDHICALSNAIRGHRA